MTLKNKRCELLPQMTIDAAKETLAAVVNMEQMCKKVLRSPALLEVSITDANDLVPRPLIHSSPPPNSSLLHSPLLHPQCEIGSPSLGAKGCL